MTAEEMQQVEFDVVDELLSEEWMQALIARRVARRLCPEGAAQAAEAADNVVPYRR